MTSDDFKRLLENKKDKHMGVAAWCEYCGGNIMHAPLHESLEDHPKTWKFCCSECRHCKRKNPPVSVKTFSDEEFRTQKTYSRYYYTKRNSKYE